MASLTCVTQDPVNAALCQQEGIQLQAFAPIARGQKKDDPVLLSMAKDVNRHWNHVLLRWSFQRGCVALFLFPLPYSSVFSELSGVVSW